MTPLAGNPASELAIALSLIEGCSSTLEVAPIERALPETPWEALEPGQSILISGIRCLLTYLLFPFIFPIIGVTSGIGSTIGLIVGTIAIVANVFSIRRFHRADHKYKWPVSALNAGVIVLLVVLIVLDANDLFS